MAQYMSSNQQSDDREISEQVVTAVARARDEDPLELPPLYDVIDPDALDHLFDHGTEGGRTGPGRVIFILAGCEVVVHSDGEVDVTAPDGRMSPSSATRLANKRGEAETRLE